MQFAVLGVVPVTSCTLVDARASRRPHAERRATSICTRTRTTSRLRIPRTSWHRSLSATPWCPVSGATSPAGSKKIVRTTWGVASGSAHSARALRPHHQTARRRRTTRKAVRRTKKEKVRTVARKCCRRRRNGAFRLQAAGGYWRFDARSDD